MAAPGPRKRSGPALCGAGWARGPAPAAALGNGVPPHKRPKGPAAGAEAPEDPFGDGDDFTADDLEEIDTIASQALSQDAAPPGHAWGGRAGPWGRAAGKEPRGSGAESGLLRDAFRLEVLQTQHEETRHKLREMQDEILIKNGEIKILRDSMQQMEYAMEEQKKSYMLLEQQKSQTLKEREREFSKKSSF